MKRERLCRRWGGGGGGRGRWGQTDRQTGGEKKVYKQLCTLDELVQSRGW